MSIAFKQPVLLVWLDWLPHSNLVDGTIRLITAGGGEIGGLAPNRDRSGGQVLGSAFLVGGIRHKDSCERWGGVYPKGRRPVGCVDGPQVGTGHPDATRRLPDCRPRPRFSSRPMIRCQRASCAKRPIWGTKDVLGPSVRGAVFTWV